MKQRSMAGTVFFAVLSLIWCIPMIVVLLNSFKSNDAINRSLFSLPDTAAFAGGEHYQTALTFGNYPFLRSFGYSVLISAVSTLLPTASNLIFVTQASLNADRITLNSRSM